MALTKSRIEQMIKSAKIRKQIKDRKEQLNKQYKYE